MTTVTPPPDVALPVGADPENTDSWDTFRGVTSRLVWSKPEPLPEHLASYDIRLVAEQHLDGTILDAAIADDIMHEGPLVYIGGDAYSPADARLIAHALTAVADLAESWAGR